MVILNAKRVKDSFLILKMNSFTSNIKSNIINNTELKSTIIDSHTSCALRTLITHFLLTRKSEREYISLDCLNQNYLHDIKIIHKNLPEIRDELQKLGWNTKMSFGKTGLFIYSSDKPPNNCFDDNLFEGHFIKTF